MLPHCSTLFGAFVSQQVRKDLVKAHRRTKISFPTAETSSVFLLRTFLAKKWWYLYPTMLSESSDIKMKLLLTCEERQGCFHKSLEGLSSWKMAVWWPLQAHCLLCSICHSLGCNVLSEMGSCRHVGKERSLGGYPRNRFCRQASILGA